MKHFLTLIPLTLALASGSSAAMLLTDSFTYPDGLLQTVGAANWTAVDYSGGSGAAGNLIIAGEAVSMVYDSNTTRRIVYQSPLSQTITSGQVYYGFTFNTSVASGSTGGQRISGLGDGSTESMRGQVWLKAGSVDDTVRLGITNSTGTSSVAVYWGADLAINTDYQVVVEYDRTAGTSRLWVDPVSIASASVTDGTVSSSNRSSMVLYNRTNVNLGSYTIDDLKVATTFAEAIPEPGVTALLMGLPALLLVLIRRRSRQV